MHNVANIDRIRSFIEKDHHMTMRDMPEGTNVNRETVRKILRKDLGMCKVCAKMIPKILTVEQKALRVQLCEEWMNVDLEEGILNRVVTGDGLVFKSTIPVMNDSRWNGKHPMKHGQRKPECPNQK